MGVTKEKKAPQKRESKRTNELFIKIHHHSHIPVSVSFTSRLLTTGIKEDEDHSLPYVDISICQ